MVKILLVDDDPVLLDVLREILVAARYDVVSASGAREALELYRKHRPALVITDIFLPDQSGLDLIFEVTRTVGVKVIAMSGGSRHGNLDFLDCAEKFGAWRVLDKPVRREQLLSTVADAFADRFHRPGAAYAQTRSISA